MATYTVSKNALDSPDFTSLSTAFAGVTGGDIIQIIDSSTYSENFPNNMQYGNITITSNKTDPIEFPTITILNWSTVWLNWWNNNAGDRTFSNVNLVNFQIARCVNNLRGLNLDKCYISNPSLTVSAIEINNYVTYDDVNITNCVFNNSNTYGVVNLNSNLNSSGNLLNMVNNTFYSCTLISLTGTNNANATYKISNNLFNNTFIGANGFIDNANSRNNYIEDFKTGLDATTDVQKYSGNPFINTEYNSVEDFELATNLNITYITTAPTLDIASVTRNVTLVTAGAWENTGGTPVITNRFRIHVC